jgi:hypothetical protein
MSRPLAGRIGLPVDLAAAPHYKALGECSWGFYLIRLEQRGKANVQKLLILE